MKQTPLLMLSLAINVVLVAWGIGQIKNRDVVVESVSTYGDILDALSSREKITIPSPSAFARNRANVGAEQFEKLAYLAVAEFVYFPQGGSQPIEYWRGVEDNAAAIRLMDEVAAESVRQELISEFADAVQEPIFASYFYPMGPAYSFLPSETQIALHRLRSEMALSMGAPSGEQSGGIGVMFAAEDLFVQQVEQILTPEQLFEFRLRGSNLAHEMLNTRLEWSETEFREVFAILSQSYHEAGAVSVAPLGLGRFGFNQGVSAGYDLRIEAVLGRDRYLDFVGDFDPALRRIRDVANQNGVSTDQIVAVQEQYVRASEEIVALQKSGNRIAAQQRTIDRDQALLNGLPGQSRVLPTLGPIQLQLPEFLTAK